MTEANSYPSAETSISNRLNLLHGFSKERRKGAEGLFWLVIRIRKVSLPFISLLSPEKDFAEIISLKLTYGPKDLLQALDRAKTPYNAGSDKDLQRI